MDQVRGLGEITRDFSRFGHKAGTLNKEMQVVKTEVRRVEQDSSSTLQAITTLKIQPHLTDIPIVMLTGHRERDWVLQAIRAGARLYGQTNRH